MDARALLDDVAATYRELRSLAVEALSKMESGDTNAGSASHHKAQFVYRAPNRFRSRLGARGDPCAVGGQSNVRRSIAVTAVREIRH